MKPVVAIIGRPNVGKSTLFNRIVKRREALVDDMPGVTRDRHYCDATWDGVEFTLVDTGGFLEKDEDRFAKEIRFQVTQAIEDADLILLVMDGKSGISPYDVELLEILRNVEKPVFYLVNKIDGEKQEENLYEFYSLGIEEPFPVSGEHGYGVPDFMDAMVEDLPVADVDDEDDMISIAVVGRPNAGKSSLINKLLGEDRLVVSDVAGTTRDSIDSILQNGDTHYRLVDTAGIRRKGKVSEKIEKLSIIKSLKSLDRCDVALIMIDASEGITDQDISIAGYAESRGCGCVFLLNKWDIVDRSEKSTAQFYDDLERKAKFLYYAPAMTISALTGLRVKKIFKMVDEVFQQFDTRIPTGELNRIMEWATERTPPSLHKGKRLKYFYSTQVASKPPTIVSFVNYPEAVHFSYKRYLINQLRDSTGLDKTPLKLIFREKTGRLDFADIKNEAKHSRNKGDIDKVSRNKERKKKERKIQGQRKKMRELGKK